MPTPIVFEDVAPVVPVRDLQAALERYRQLGFEVRAYGHGTVLAAKKMPARRFPPPWVTRRCLWRETEMRCEMDFS